jgi:hypothetical protein
LEKTSEENLWSDPRSYIEGFEKSERGRGFYFGIDAVDEFEKREGIELIIRSHEYCESGFSWSFGRENGLLTIFSSVDYCGEKNDGSVCLLKEDCKYDLHQLSYERLAKHRRSLIPLFVLKSIRFQNLGFHNQFHDTELLLKVNLLI